MILNIGHGNQGYGDVLIDIYPSKSTTIRNDIESGLPLKNDTFDEVYSRCVIEHMRNPGRLINEMVRVCRPDGRIVIITDNAGYWRYYSHFDIGRTHCGGYCGSRGSKDRHFSVFTVDHLRNHLEAAKLQSIEIEYLSWEDQSSVSRLKIYPFTGWIDTLLARMPPLRHMAFPRIRATGVKLF